MTNTRPAIAAILLLLAALLAGCGKEVEVFPEPGGMTEAAEALRRSPTGPIIASFSPYPLKKGSPPDGVRRAVRQAAAAAPCSAASFYWAENDLARNWLSEQIAARRNAGEQPRVILVGHGLGATEASEMAWHILRKEPDVVIALLGTVDAIKTGRIGSAAGVTGTVIVGSIPGVKANFTSYDSAPAPDGVRLLAHVNYFQRRTSVYHGSEMPNAENHLLSDSKGMLNHGNVDDVAFPRLYTDIRAAMRTWGTP